MVEVIHAEDAGRSSINEVYQTGGTPPAANDWGCENTTGGSSKYVNKIQTDSDGKVSILVATGIKTDVDGTTVTLTPMINGVPAKATIPSAGGNMATALSDWRSGVTVADLTLPLKYLPGSCRGN